MKTIQRRPLAKAILADAIIYALFCALLWWQGAFTFSYLEHTTTFFYQKMKILGIIEEPGGLCQVISDFLIQFFVSPTAGVLITAALLTAITILTARMLRNISETMAYTPLAFLPAIALAFLHYNVNYMYSGTVAMLIMLIAVNIMFRSNYKLRFSSPSYRVIYSAVATFFLYTSAGPVAILFGAIIFIATLFRHPREAVYYLICPVLTVLQAFIAVRSGLICDMDHALLPDAYFTHRLIAPSIVYLPGAFMLAIVFIASLMSKISGIGLKVKWSIFILTFVGVTAYAIISGNKYADSEREAFKQLNCYLRAGDWDKVIETCHGKEITNMLQQNCLNLALAEKGMLADSIFNQPCVDIRNIYINDSSNPFLYMLLSDIYYSMGHIALSQRYAFEANESLYNKSPRMLQRLVDANILMGNYKVAKKYLNRLHQTLFYHDWVHDRLTALSDEGVAAHPELSKKKACVFPDNRFSGIYGLDDDLIQVVRNNPTHTVTLQYLGTLELLSKNLPRFREVIDEFYGSAPLPQSYQEAILSIEAEGDSIPYSISPATLQRYEQFKANPTADKKNFWYFKKYVR